MDNKLTDSILNVCRILNKHSVQYLIIGGTAVALHGFFRWSMSVSDVPLEKYDLDFWYNPTYNNYFKLLDALEELGQDMKRYNDEQAPNPQKSIFRMELDDFTMDFLPELVGLPKFSESFADKQTVTLNEVAVHFINLEDLIMNKEATGRPKDMIDIRELKMRNQNKNRE